MKILFILFILVCAGCSVGEPWYYNQPYYCLNFVNQQMVYEDGSKAPDEKQYCIKIKPEKVPTLTNLGVVGYDYSMGAELYGYWQVEGPYLPLKTPEFVAYQKWLKKK